MMGGKCLLLLVCCALAGFAEAQNDMLKLNCAASLSKLNPRIDATCCKGKCNGIPPTCNTRCAQIWTPFWNKCSSQYNSLTVLRDFNKKCEASKYGDTTCSTKQYNDLALKVKNACCGSQRFSACRRSKVFTPPATCSSSCAPIFESFFHRCQRTLAQQTSGKSDFHGQKHIKALTNFVAKCQATQLAKKPVPGQKSTYTTTHLYFSSAAQAYASSNVNKFENQVRADLAFQIPGIATQNIIITDVNPATLDSSNNFAVTVDLFGPASMQQMLIKAVQDQNNRVHRGAVTKWLTTRTDQATVAAGGSTGVAMVKVDNSYVMTVNGKRIGAGSNWQTAQKLRFSAPCAKGQTVYGIHAKDSGGIASIIATIKHCNKTFNTDTRWRCTAAGAPPAGWDTPSGYSGSAAAFERSSDSGINGAAPWGFDSRLDTNAHWIWSNDTSGINEVWCRFQEGVDQIATGTGLGGYGTAHFSGDDQFVLYVDGKRLGEGTQRQKRLTETFNFRSSCSTPTVFAVNGVDKGGLAAIIGDITHCGESITTIPQRWKCSKTCPFGWARPGFDDSKWPFATDWGSNGAAPFGHRDVSGESHWIWTKDDNRDNQACCRYVDKHVPLNCPAAQRMYVKNYPTVKTASAAYAFHMKQGHTQGWIWNSELCTADGKDIYVKPDFHGTAHFSVDNGYDLYVNGKKIGSGSNWQTTQSVAFDSQCNQGTVYAIDAYDTGGVASILGQIDHCGEEISTGINWRCTVFPGNVAPAGWSSNLTFDDSVWPPAASLGKNGVAPWGKRGDITDKASWIWDADANGHNHVFCRYVSYHKPLDCPAAQGRYWADYPDVAAYNKDSEPGNGMEAWDHYQQAGVNEGRTWHSELCNADGTNKASECDKKHTGTDYKYNFMSSRLGPEKAITFSVRANNDAHIGFFESQAKGGSRSGFGPQYEIVLSGWGGTQSVIRDTAQGTPKVVSKTTGYLNKNDYRQFWASAANGLVRIGTGNVVGLNEFMQWQDPDDILDITYAGVATGWGSDGDWVVCIPERCTGQFYAADATLQGATAHTVPARGGKPGGSYVQLNATTPSDVRFHLAGCAAGHYTVGITYQLASPKGNLSIAVNGVQMKHEGQNLLLPMSRTGRYAREAFLQQSMDFGNGENIVTIASPAVSGYLLFIEVMPAQGGKLLTASQGVRGVAHITADNGYVLYINGQRIGGGGRAVPSTDRHYHREGWQNTDTYAFQASCNVYTEYAIEGVDKEGVAAVLGQFEHCGQVISTSSDWKCAPVTTAALADHSTMANRRFYGINKAMSWSDANNYCRAHYTQGNLASIHSIEDQRRASKACADIIKVDKLQILSCTSSTSGRGEPCNRAYDGKNGGPGVFSFAKNQCSGSVQFTLAKTTTVGKVSFEQRSDARSMWTAAKLTFSDRSTQTIKLQLKAGKLVQYTIKPVATSFIKVEVVSLHDASLCNKVASLAAQGTHNVDGKPWLGVGMEEILFFESGSSPHGCWIGLNDGTTEGSLAWTDGSPVDYVNWASGEPNSYHGLNEDFVEMDFRLFSTTANRAGQWNDVVAAGSNSGRNKGDYFVCEDIAYTAEVKTTYLGCFNTSYTPGHAATNVGTTHFTMGRSASPATCAKMCTDYHNFALYGQVHCVCFNTGYTNSPKLPESACNLPCLGQKSAKCGGAGGSAMSIYEELASQYWQNAGFDDSTWQAATELGPNGVAPWYHRPSINDDAKWIWTQDAQKHDHVFCRYTQANKAVDCPAAESQYWEDYPDIKRAKVNSFSHFTRYGRKEGRTWHSELCATTAKCLTLAKCPNKCEGMHDAAQATITGATVKTDQIGHYGQGFVEFNQAGGNAVFNLVACTAGMHTLKISYALKTNSAGDNMRLTVNGVFVKQIDFVPTGSFTTYGEIYVDGVQLLQGANSMTLTALSTTQGPHLDFVDVLKKGDVSTGVAHISADNSYTLFVNGKQIGTGNNWMHPGTHEFSGHDPAYSCTAPTVFAVHALDAGGVGAVIADITHCGEEILTSKRWKCFAGPGIAHGTPPPANWMTAAFDDSAWESAYDYGANGAEPWYGVNGKRREDGISAKARWIWTNDADGQNEIWCRFTSEHKPVNCEDAAAQYFQDYPRDQQSGVDAWTQFNQKGKWQGKIWHSEICSETCSAKSSNFDWVDAKRYGTPAPMASRKDDSWFDVQLPFSFPFFGQRKKSARVSTNGYLTFSGEHFAYGNSFKIPNTKIPNDLVAPYWTDLNPEHGGQIYTYNGTYDQACPVGLSHGRSCCAASCGTCGGTGCSARMGGASACCEGNILKANKKCSTTQTAPCVMDERHFAIQWDAVPMFKSTAKSTFQALLFESGKIKFQYLDVSAPTDTHVSVGIENGAGTEGLQVAYDDPSFYSRKNFSYIIPNSCGSVKKVMSVGYFNSKMCPDAHNCNMTIADDFCYKNYGGQLASPTDDSQYTTLRDQVNGDGGGHHYMLGLKSSGAGKWSWTDGSPMNITYLRTHSSDNLAGTSEFNGVFDPDADQRSNGKGLNDCCHSWTMDSFVCEFYAAPKSVAIGLHRNFTDANKFCKKAYGPRAHLATIHNQKDYDRLAALSSNWPHPILIGLSSDGKGNWRWVDNSPADIKFLRAHSADGLKGTSETQAAFYPPTASASAGTGHDKGLHDWNVKDAPNALYAFFCDTP